MRTNSLRTSDDHARRFARGTLCRAAGALLALTLLAGCSGPPQLGGDEQCLGAADALWTAIGARQQDLVNQSATEIDRLHTAGKMPDDAHTALTDIVATARSEEWDDARRSLKSFVQGQRRAAH
ncbi:MAG: hypothetical protein AB7O59_12840 [Pirellulales bacterium]